MLRLLAAQLSVIMIAALAVPGAARGEGAGLRPVLQVLSYHDVSDDPLARPDPLTVSTDQLVSHFDWLRRNGYTVVSMAQVAAATHGGPPLPPRAVLLTFDDGLRSAYTRVLPLLRLYRYPAVVAVVTSWLEAPPDAHVPYGDADLPRGAFLSWRELAEMIASGLVEVASHSHAMHHGISANPQGNLQPAAVTRRFDPQARQYESASAYRARIDADLARSADIITRRLGVSPRVIAWPYGAYNAEAVALAATHGMPFSLTLASMANDGRSPHVIHRHLVDADTDAGRLERMLESPHRRLPGRYVHVDLDYVYDPDPAVQERNLGHLVERIARIGPTAVFLQAYADPDGDDVADAVYFPNRHLPVRADLFNRAAWQLRTRAQVAVFAWMPIMAYAPPPGRDAPARVRMAGPDGPVPSPHVRLSPFDPQVRLWVAELYEDLAAHARFDGILFHDDGVLSDFEDFSPAARAAYRAHGLPDDPGRLRSDPAAAELWTGFKIRWLHDFTDELVARMRRYNPELTTARNLFARTLHEPHARAWLGQSVAEALDRYDLTVVMAMPYLEQVPEHGHLDWLRTTVQHAVALDPGLDRVVFELQAVDWARREPVPAARLAAWIGELHRLGARHIAYYPDDLHRDHPPLATVGRLMSVRSLHREAVHAR